MNGAQYRRSSKRTTIRSYSRGSISNSSVQTTSTAATRKDIFDNSEKSPGAPSISHLKSFHSLEKSTFRFRNQSQSTVGTIREAGSVRNYTTASTSKQEIRSLNIPSFEDEDESPLPSTLRSSLSTLPEPGPSSSRIYGVPPSTPLEDPSTKPYGDSHAERPQAAPLTGSSSRVDSGTHSYSGNHSYPHPPAPPSSNPDPEPPPTFYHTGSTAQHPPSHIDPHPHVDSQQSSSHTDSISMLRRPPSIVYAPSINSSLYEYNPPVITSYPLPDMPIHKPTPHYAYAHHRVQPISDPTRKGGLLGRSSTPGHQFEEILRPKAPIRVPKAAHARIKESQKKVRSRKDKLRRKRRDGAGGADNDGLDDDASFSSSSSSAPVIPLQLLHQKRPLLQRIFQFVFSSNANAT